MASLSSIYIKRETLQTLLDVVSKKGEKGVELTVSIEDASNQYGQNLSAWVSQSKEQREAKANRFYVGNGKCFWSDGKITRGEKTEGLPQPTQQSSGVENYDDLPY